MCGLWFGASKPEMNGNFLKPFEKELSTLSDNGFLWECGNKKVLTSVSTYMLK